MLDSEASECGAPAEDSNQQSVAWMCSRGIALSEFWGRQRSRNKRLRIVLKRLTLKPGYIVVHIGNPRTREVEAEGSGVLDHPPLCSELKFKAGLGYMRPVSKQNSSDDSTT